MHSSLNLGSKNKERKALLPCALAVTVAHGGPGGSRTPVRITRPTTRCPRSVALACLTSNRGEKRERKTRYPTDVSNGQRLTTVVSGVQVFKL